jgi:glycosyltransferase involved in cell wall biosynthesis
MRQGVKQMDRLVTNSEFNRRVMMEGMGAPSSVEVIRYGLDHHNFRPYGPDDESEVRNRFGLEKPFIIYVANRAPKKQPHVAVRSFKHVEDAGFDHELIVVGSRYEG